MKRDVRVILHDIRSNFNVGSAFRTSDAAGVSHVYLTGYTPAPLDQYNRPNKELAKVALGANQSVKWTKEADVFVVISQLKQQGFFIIAVEQAMYSVDYKTVTLPEKAAFVFGNEVEGIGKDVLKQCDMVAEIPMSGKKESLNVSVSFGIALFRMLDL